jgi:hypothetical protein
MTLTLKTLTAAAIMAISIGIASPAQAEMGVMDKVRSFVMPGNVDTNVEIAVTEDDPLVVPPALIEPAAGATIGTGWDNVPGASVPEGNEFSNIEPAAGTETGWDNVPGAAEGADLMMLEPASGDVTTPETEINYENVPGGMTPETMETEATDMTEDHSSLQRSGFEDPISGFNPESLNAIESASGDESDALNKTIQGFEDPK